MTVAADTQDDETRVEFEQIVGCESPSLQGSGTEVLDENVDLRGKLPDDLLTFRAPQV